MPRYIDADKFAERIKVSPAFPNMGFEGHFLRNVVLDLLDNAPTADVAPKSEVARKIFAEIDKIIIGCRVDEYSKEFGYVVRQNYNGASIVRYLAELKKKYTEGEK